MRCPECKRSFAKKRPWQKYCSEECGTAARNRKRQKKVKRALVELDRMNAIENGVMGGRP